MPSAAAATSAEIGILIADDEPLVRAGLRMLLHGEPGVTVLGEAEDGRSAVEAVRILRPTVALMDVRMPFMDGVEATQQITAPSDDPACRPSAVLVMSTFNLDEAVYAALRAGAAGFLLKAAATRDLVTAVHAVARGDAWIDSGVARALIAEFASRPHKGMTRPTDLESLTARECDVLVLIAHGMNNAEIAAHLVVGEGTVKTHVSHIFRKLGFRDRAQAAAAAYRTGLVGIHEPSPRPASRPSDY